MRKIALVSLLAVAGLLLGAGPGQADPRHRGHVWPHSRVGVHVGVGWWGPGPWWYGPRYYSPYSPYPYYPPPAVIIESPPVYIERTPPPPPAPPAYWYYCPSARQYYPTVRECPEPWVPVPPRSP